MLIYIIIIILQRHPRPFWDQPFGSSGFTIFYRQLHVHPNTIHPPLTLCPSTPIANAILAGSLPSLLCICPNNLKRAFHLIHNVCHSTSPNFLVPDHVPSTHSQYPSQLSHLTPTQQVLHFLTTYSALCTIHWYWSHYGLIQLTLRFCGIFWSHAIPVISLHLVQAILILCFTASVAPPPYFCFAIPFCYQHLRFLCVHLQSTFYQSIVPVDLQWQTKRNLNAVMPFHNAV